MSNHYKIRFESSYNPKIQTFKLHENIIMTGKRNKIFRYRGGGHGVWGGESGAKWRLHDQTVYPRLLFFPRGFYTCRQSQPTCFFLPLSEMFVFYFRIDRRWGIREVGYGPGPQLDSVWFYFEICV